MPINDPRHLGGDRNLGENYEAKKENDRNEVKNTPVHEIASKYSSLRIKEIFPEVMAYLDALRLENNKVAENLLEKYPWVGQLASKIREALSRIEEIERINRASKK